MKTDFLSLAAEYQNLWRSMQIDDNRIDEADAIARRMIQLKNKIRYFNAQAFSKVPWFAIAAIHYRESDMDWNCHLHNGDPLTARTIHEPTGRPTLGDPPFSWEASAADAMRLANAEDWAQVSSWTMPAILWRLEAYNGWGYRLSHPGVNTPYLWSGTNHYQKGKYSADGEFDPDIIDEQLGAAVILHRLISLA